MGTLVAVIMSCRVVSILLLLRLQDLPLKKVRNFGGKLGEQLEALGCTTAGQVGAG